MTSEISDWTKEDLARVLAFDDVLQHEDGEPDIHGSYKEQARYAHYMGFPHYTLKNLYRNRLGKDMTVKSESAIEGILKVIDEILSTQELLVEMISDLYEVGQMLSSKVGISIQPSSQVKTWLKEREEEKN